MSNHRCLGCRLANKEEKVYLVYENSLLSCILDHDPFNPGHVMILPKEHVEEGLEFNEEMNMAVMKAIQLLSKTINELYRPDGITICQNGGIFSDLTHYHMHVVPRFQGQDFAEFYIEIEEPEEPEEPFEVTAEKMRSYIGSLLEKES
ncbi:HIT family protein [Rossellomorea aquimaris]|uniref:HIT family protein n=1 Tax=Rossellomorea aquimaris TaxID=189382 RepID=UPI001CD745BA|nr:HIT family protein [Rossellomorea aquimaris]MCA1053797.1 HIT family protein [Rossellomorea aquimaris]